MRANRFITRVPLLVLLFLSSCSCNSVQFSNGIDSVELVTNPCQDVRKGGFICVDCATLGFCANVDGQWQTVSMTECDAARGFFCNDEGAIGCTWQQQCQVPVRGKFYCQLPGIFPDPYDCRSYHVCDERNVDTPQQCTNGAGYSLLAQSCSLPRESEQCTTKQYTCNSVGQTGAWAADPSYYYVCQKDSQGSQDVYYPLMLQCQSGYVFNNHSCVPQTSGANYLLPKSRETHKVIAPPLVHAENQTQSCTNGMLYPANDTKGYYYCSKNELTYQSCPEGSYYDNRSMLCRHGAYDSVNDAITCGDVGSETGPSLSVCTGFGMVQDMTNCSRYYSCEGKNAVMQHGTCATGTIYDPSSYSCKSGTC
ncbi:uncharacterized protein LOC115632665 [Scaptodrosophila lebanonensis]|uniref:Uncharacterized protein LOC115632665 n=1 Tax=Drosophila lebanonensis TaxID=7225 RepID=A0A6J2UEA6_DROLE|nr:uncharacterized protein LOC115632665 [Scaptodrosophila lebanonensis]